MGLFSRSVSLAILASLVVASNAKAGEAFFDLRFDYQSSTFNEDAKAASASNRTNSAFKIQTGRVDYKAKLGEDLAFRLRLRFDKNFSSTNYRTIDGTSNWVDYAYVTHKINDDLSFTFGKLYGGGGGVAALAPPPDLYFLNKAYTYGIVNGYVFTTGAKATYTVLDQEFSLILFNNPKDIDTDTTRNATVIHSRSGVGAYYHGKFADGMVEPVVSYHTASYDMDDTQNKERKDALTTVGAKFRAGGAIIDLDYHSYAYAKKSSTTDDDTLKTTYFMVTYPIDAWTPKLAYEASEDYLASSKVKTTYNVVSAALEFKPNTAENFRYHVAYNILSNKSDASGAKTLAENQVVAGIRFFGDFLK